MAGMVGRNLDLTEFDLSEGRWGSKQKNKQGRWLEGLLYIPGGSDKLDKGSAMDMAGCSLLRGGSGVDVGSFHNP